ncbi:DUF4843 domain-containing protein [Flavobacteriaceae bacterium F08102]|nr:DUF4843 domain-containing protein [Flavobacteriaceae bacterium F08102]
MKNIKFNAATLVLLALVLVVTSCTKDEIMSFKGQPGVTFLPSENSTFDTKYSFLGNSSGEYIQEVDVQIVGEAADVDRYFNVKVINDEKTTASESQYEIVEGIVKANEYQGKLYIKLFNSNDLDDKTVSIHLELVPSDDFVPGAIETNEFTVSWTNQIVIPSWTYYRFFFVSTPSTLAYRLIVETTGLTEFGRNEYRDLGTDGATALATKFGDYVKQYNLEHPGNPLVHDDGALAGEEIVPKYYTKSKYD